MDNNDVMRRIRFIFDFNDDRMIALFQATGFTVTRAQISDWLKRDDDPAYVACSDRELAIFLNGLIIFKRGKKDGPPPKPESKLDNNLVLRKLKIALNARDDDMLETLSVGGRHLGKSELSAFFRRPDHRHYRRCQDQILRNFLQGLQLQLRPNADADAH